MTLDEWVEAALAARVAQGLPEHVEDPATLDYLADVLSRPRDLAGRDEKPVYQGR